MSVNPRSRRSSKKAPLNFVTDKTSKDDATGEDGSDDSIDLINDAIEEEVPRQQKSIFVRTKEKQKLRVEKTKRLDRILNENDIDGWDHMTIEEKEQICDVLQASKMDMKMIPQSGKQEYDEGKLTLSQDLFQSQEEVNLASQETQEECPFGANNSTNVGKDLSSSQGAGSSSTPTQLRKRKSNGDTPVIKPSKVQRVLNARSVLPDELEVKSGKKSPPSPSHVIVRKLINKRRRRIRFIRKDSNIFHPKDSMDHIAATTEIIKYFENYRVRLREAQSKLTEIIPWGMPVNTGRHCLHTLNLWHRDTGNRDYIRELQAIEESSSQDSLPNLEDEPEKPTERVTRRTQQPIVKKNLKMDAQTVAEGFMLNSDNDSDTDFQFPVSKSKPKQKATASNFRGKKKSQKQTHADEDNFPDFIFGTPEKDGAFKENINHDEGVKPNLGDVHDKVEAIKRKKYQQVVVMESDDDTQVYDVEEVAVHEKENKELNVEQDTKESKTLSQNNEKDEPSLKTNKGATHSNRSKLTRKRKGSTQQNQNLSKYLVRNDEIPTNAGDDDDDVMVLFESPKEVCPDAAHARQRIESDDLNVSLGSRAAHKLVVPSNQGPEKSRGRRRVRQLFSSDDDETQQEEEDPPGFEKCPVCQALFLWDVVAEHVSQCRLHEDVQEDEVVPNKPLDRVKRMMTLQHPAKHAAKIHRPILKLRSTPPDLIPDTHVEPATSAAEVNMERCVICGLLYPAGEALMQHVNDCLDQQEAESQKPVIEEVRFTRRQGRTRGPDETPIIMMKNGEDSSCMNQNSSNISPGINSDNESGSTSCSETGTDSEEENTLSSYISSRINSNHLRKRKE